MGREKQDECLDGIRLLLEKYGLTLQIIISMAPDDLSMRFDIIPPEEVPPQKVRKADGEGV